ncbi:MAG: magnesium/cobalt transporter CorA [bacterium]
MRKNDVLEKIGLKKINPLKWYQAPSFFEKKEEKVGLPPGTLVYIGEKKMDKVLITFVDYDEKELREGEAESIEECIPFKDTPTVTWINVTGLHDTKIIERLGGSYGIHPLVLEDIVSTGQRPKIEDFGDYLYVVMRMIFKDRSRNEFVTEQISIIVGKNFVITFQEAESDVFGPVIDRLKNQNGRFRKSGADYLAYSLIDIIVDNYNIVIEEIGERVENLEEKLLVSTEREDLRAIQTFKKDMIFLRRAVWPAREVAGELLKSESALISKATRVFFKDVQDHVLRAVDSIEMFRDTLSGMLDTYQTGISNKMNEVMKVLTIIATIFIPLTFIAGVYGMNFEYIPELKWHWGYFGVWGVMAGSFVVMMVYFRKKKWF